MVGIMEAGQSARDASVVQAAVLGGVGRTADAPGRRVAAARAAARCCPSGVIGGILPSAGSTTSHGRLPLVISKRSDQ